MKKLFVLIAVVMMAVGLQAQNWGVGVKFGWDYGLNIKKYTGNNALEGVIDFHNGGFRATGLYEWEQKLDYGFRVYYGFGASLGMWDDYDDESGFGLGINGILGVEWHPNAIPFTFALDWMPSFQLIPSSGFWAKGLAFSVKYVW